MTRALLSCHDKTGLEAFAKRLAALGIELVASGGTAEFLARQGLKVRTVEAFTGMTERLDGRVKTLHPKIHAGILARRDEPGHVQAVGAGELIDLVVVNLYPFERTVQQPGVSLAEAVEQIDIGGVALLRAAAKNFAHVLAVSHPAQYAAVAEALAAHQGAVPAELARELATAAFRQTSRYDAWIAEYLAGVESGGLGATASVTVRKRQALRYGENPHQQGGWYEQPAGPSWALGTMTQHQGKELSYNNLLDIDAALRVLMEFDEPACAIVKHHSQCGMSCGATIRQAYERAYACDEESAFGGIVGVNRPVDAALAALLAATFLEVVMAPSVEPGAFALLGKRQNLRVVTLDWPKGLPPGGGIEWRQLLGGWLLQDMDRASLDPAALRVVTKRAPTEDERRDLMFAWRSAKHVKSNAIVLARELATVGIGQGQPSRVGSVRVALEKAGPRAQGAVAASDGFFPFPDGVELLARAGVTAVIQPGGSIRDGDVIAAADRVGMAMLMTGVRHFRH